MKLGECKTNLKPSLDHPKLRRFLAVSVTFCDELSPFGILIMARKLFNPVMILNFTIFIAITVCLTSARDSLRYTDSDYHLDDDLVCPEGCDCADSIVDCSGSNRLNDLKQPKAPESKQPTDRW